MADSGSDGAARALLAAATLLAGGVALAAGGPAAAQGSWSRPAGEARGRPVSDQDVARDNRERGELWPLGDLLPIATREGRGRYLGVETGTPIYRFKFLRDDGEVVWVDVDARSGRVVRVRP
jgi:hypothetical protein